MTNLFLPLLLAGIGIWRFCRIRLGKDSRSALPGGRRMSDAQLRLMEIVYHISRMRLLEAYTSLIVWLLAAAWAYVCFGADGLRISIWWFVLVVVALVALRTWLQVRWARRTPDEQQAYMRENNIDTDALSDAATVSRKESAAQLDEQRKALRKSALWAVPVAAAIVVLAETIVPDYLDGDWSRVLILAAEGYIFAFCVLCLVLNRRKRK